MRRFSGRRTKEVQGVKGGEGGRARKKKKSSARAMSQIIVLELCSMCRARARAPTQSSHSPPPSAHSSRLNATMLLSLFLYSMILFSSSSFGRSEKLFLYILQQSALFSFFFPPRLNFLLPIKTTKKNDVTWPETDVGCSCSSRSKVSESTRHPAGIKLRDEVLGRCSYRCSCPPPHPPFSTASSGTFCPLALSSLLSLSFSFIHSFQINPNDKNKPSAASLG